MTAPDLRALSNEELLDEYEERFEFEFTCPRRFAPVAAAKTLLARAEVLRRMTP